MAEEKQEKKIHIDQDWKTEAKLEKEKLAVQEKVEKEEAEQQQEKRGPLPKGDFGALLSMLATQALFAMGLIQMDKEKKEPDLGLAKYNIDMIEMLQEKTKGNLSEEEEKGLENALEQLHMAYVKVAG